ncbi:MAG TPA: MMPL family transporter, partial [Pseudomonadales bacterium]
ASQYLFLYEMSLPAGHDLTRDINSSRSSSRLMVSLNTMTNQELIELDLRAQQWLSENAPELASPGGSRSLMFANLGQNIVSSMISGSIFAMGAITIVILIGIRSLRYGVISLIPNVLPAACVYGAWGLFVGEVNQAAAMVFSMSIGLVVDDTIHFLSKYLKGLKNGKSAEESIKYAFTTAGSALLVTSLAISAGMSVLILSSFNPNTTMAVMLFSILLFALVLDFMLLPPVLLLFDKKKDQVIVQAEFNATSKEASDEIEIDVAAVPVEISEATPDGSKVTT